MVNSIVWLMALELIYFKPVKHALFSFKHGRNTGYVYCKCTSICRTLYISISVCTVYKCTVQYTLYFIAYLIHLC